MTIFLLLRTATLSSSKATDTELEMEAATVNVLNACWGVVSAGPEPPDLATLGGLFTLQQPLREGSSVGTWPQKARHPAKAYTPWGNGTSSPLWKGIYWGNYKCPPQTVLSGHTLPRGQEGSYSLKSSEASTHNGGEASGPRYFCLQQ